MSPPSYTASAPSVTSPSAIGVGYGFLGLSLLDEYFAVTAICVVFILYFIAFSCYKSRLNESELSGTAVGAAPVRELEMVRIEASGFTCGGGDDGEECVICLTEFKKGEKCWIMSKCCHVFHRNCIDRWLKAERHCPLCRSCVCVAVHGGNNIISSTPISRV
ncbi:RING-H2 finger protein ATL1-like [Momordica charantia]|uniref:RING-H2 finger protein ATL1-like n=1 Tax=Momordica charantia TaxID=3673 RepID=A0A6J1DN25_MOMCH|nr:RING-H2 finger protein ATL1-like [Momordica charantia]